MALNFVNLATFLQKKIISILSFHFLEGSNHPSDPQISKNGPVSDRIRIGSGFDPGLIPRYKLCGVSVFRKKGARVTAHSLRSYTYI